MPHGSVLKVRGWWVSWEGNEDVIICPASWFCSFLEAKPMVILIFVAAPV